MEGWLTKNSRNGIVKVHDSGGIPGALRILTRYRVLKHFDGGAGGYNTAADHGGERNHNSTADHGGAGSNKNAASHKDSADHSGACNHTGIRDYERAGTSLLEAELLTGRTHQIRAHLAHIGHPIIGDGKYCPNNINKLYRKNIQQLWAYKLVFDFSSVKGIPLTYLKGFVSQIEINY
jgi:hypothetical protein